MATITKNRSKLRQFGGFTPYGNLSLLPFVVRTSAAGALIDSDSTAAIASGDKLDLGPLPEGFRLSDSIVTVTTGLSASVTGNLGFEYEDGVDSAEVPQNASYFGSALNINTAAVLRKVTTTAPVILPKPARLILTTGGAANAKASEVHIHILGELTGPR